MDTSLAAPILIFLSILIVFFIFYWKNRKNKALVNDAINELEVFKVYVTPARVITLSFVFIFIGVVTSGIGILAFSLSGFFPKAGALVFILTGCMLVYQSVVFFVKRKSILQLKITSKGIYHKPIKWYSRGRRDRESTMNALSVYFTDDWRFTPYNELSSAELKESYWEGNAIYLIPKIGKKIKLLFFMDDNEQVADLYSKICGYLPAYKSYDDKAPGRK